MVNRREFLAAAAATSSVAKLTASMGAVEAVPFGVSVDPAGNSADLAAQPFSCRPAA